MQTQVRERQLAEVIVSRDDGRDLSLEDASAEAVATLSDPSADWTLVNSERRNYDEIVITFERLGHKRY